MTQRGWVKLRLVIGLALLTAFPSLVVAEEFAAKVIGITDGDTLTVLRGSVPLTIRLYGIDAPEAGQAFGFRAKRHAATLAFGERVTVRPRYEDRYGRTAADVLLPDGQSLGRRMVEDGYAWWSRRHAPGDPGLRDAEHAARDAERGLWAAPSPTPPWEWRFGIKASRVRSEAAGHAGDRHPQDWLKEP